MQSSAELSVSRVMTCRVSAYIRLLIQGRPHHSIYMQVSCACLMYDGRALGINIVGIGSERVLLLLF